MANLYNLDNKFIVTDGNNGRVLVGATNDIGATLFANHPSTTAPSLTFNAPAGQVFENEDLQIAFGLNNASPYNGYMQTRFVSAPYYRNLAINPLGGNVGIGTNSPGTTLDVAGNVSLANYAGTAENKTILAQNSYGQVASGIRSGVPYFGSISPLNLDIYTGNSSKIRIENSTGNVGIGTDLPDSKLDVKGASATPADGNQTLSITNTTGGTQLNIGTAENSYGWIEAREGATLRNLLLNPNGGNVGIGTASPSTELQVESTNPIITLQRNNNGNAGGAVQFRGSDSVVDWQMGTNQVVGLGLEFNFQNSNKVYIETGGSVGIGTTSPFSGAKLDVNGNIYAKATAATIDVSAYNTTSGLANADLHLAVTSSGEGQVRMYGNYPLTFYTNNTEKMRIRSGGEVNIGSTGDFSAGKLVIQQNQSENGGILTLQNGGTHGYYTRVLHNATSTSQAGYWHIKTNIPVGGNVMFIAKFYGYIYGSAQVLDLTHAGYAYSGTNTVINQGVQNNGNNVNSSSAYYTSANGGKVCFRVAFGAGATFSTYFAGVYMDMAFPSPAGQGHDFEIEAQSFSQNTTVY